MKTNDENVKMVTDAFGSIEDLKTSLARWFGAFLGSKDFATWDDDFRTDEPWRYYQLLEYFTNLEKMQVKEPAEV
ncbi:MAG: hypothetical protein JXB17_08420 [Bacteroidales bacterium]|nr:hypothetical protein [Bacteroidales bacterium]